MIFAIPYLLAMGLQQDIINVRVNGTLVNPGKVYHNRTMVPTRGVLEQLGVDVKWVPATHSVIASNATTTIVLGIGQNTAQVNGQDVPLETPPFIEAGTTYVPLRFIAESMHALVGYNAATNTATVDMEAAPQPTPPPSVSPSSFGALQSTPAGWFVPGNTVHFVVPGPANQSVSLAFTPEVTDDLTMQQNPDGTYTADWTPPQNVDYGNGSVSATVVLNGQPIGGSIALNLDDPRIYQVSPQLGQAFDNGLLWIKMRDNTGPGFDVRGVSITLNGLDVTSNAQITQTDIRLNLPHGHNDLHLSIRDLAGKQFYFDSTVEVFRKADPYLSYDAPYPVRQGDLIRFHVHGPEHSPFAILLGDLVRIPFNLIREITPGQYEASYRVGPNDRFDRAAVRAVFDQGRDPLLSAPISVAHWGIDRIWGQPVVGGTLIQAYATPGSILTYFGSDGTASNFTEQPAYSGFYQLTLPPNYSNVSNSVVRPYIRLRSANQQYGLPDVTANWPERDLNVTQCEPADGANFGVVPPLIRALVDIASGPGIDLSTVRMLIDGQPARNVSVQNGCGVAFQPDPNLGAGGHVVVFDARDKLGRPIHKQWGFNFTPQATQTPARPTPPQRPQPTQPTQTPPQQPQRPQPPQMPTTPPVSQPAAMSQLAWVGSSDIIGGQSATASYQATGIPSGGRLTVTTSAPNLVSVPSTVQGASGTVSIKTQPVTRQTKVTITVATGQSSKMLTLTLEPSPALPAPQITELVTMPYRDHDAPRVVRVTLGVPAPTGGVQVNLTSLTPRWLTVVPSVIVRGGNTQVGFSITPLGVDSPQTAQIQATIGGSTKILQIPLVPAKLGPVTTPTTVAPSAAFQVIFNLKSPVGPSGATLKVSGNGPASQVKIAAGATSVTVQLVAPATAGTLNLVGELNGSKVTFNVAVN